MNSSTFSFSVKSIIQLMFVVIPEIMCDTNFSKNIIWQGFFLTNGNDFFFITNLAIKWLWQGKDALYLEICVY